MRISQWTAVACLLVSGCESRGTEAQLGDHDVVTFVRANRGHELVVRKGERTARIRLIGVYSFDARVREKNDVTALADQAISYWAETYKDKRLTVLLGPTETDPRGRFIGYLYDGKEDLGRRLISLGHAALYTEYPFKEHPEYAKAETEARTNGRGIWRERNGVAMERLLALRDTWSSLQRRRFSTIPDDPWLKEAK